MKGYKFVYVRDIPQSLEVPGSLLAHIQQKDLCTKVGVVKLLSDGIYSSSLRDGIQ